MKLETVPLNVFKDPVRLDVDTAHACKTNLWQSSSEQVLDRLLLNISTLVPAAAFSDVALL